MRLVPVAIALILLAPAIARTQQADTQAPSLDSEVPTIVLYTMGVGGMVFERYGHAALCAEFKDPSRDTCFNYGAIESESVGSLVWEFIRGTATFSQAVTSRIGMMDFYTDSDRTIWGQALPFTREQAKTAYDILLFDSRPENRAYAYNHFSDNCATRIRDIIDKASDGALTGPPLEGPGPTFRDFARQGLADSPALLILTDVLIGRSLDRAPTAYEMMFLPASLRTQVSTRLKVVPETLYNREGAPMQEGSTGRWLFVSWSLLVACAIFATRRRKPWGRAVLVLVAAPLGIVGLIAWALAITSGLSEMVYNEALLVFVPFDLAVPFLSDGLRRKYARGRVAMVVMVSIALAVGVFLQPLWASALAVFLPFLVLSEVGYGFQTSPESR